MDRFLWKMLRRSFRVLAWFLGALVLGFALVTRAFWATTRLPLLGAETRRCPRGHEVPMFGVYECAGCHAPHEGWVFGACRVCGSSAGWTPCTVCGLPVTNPFRSI
jgi:hypothetical protein